MNKHTWRLTMEEARRVASHRQERSRVVGGWSKRRQRWVYVVECGSMCAACRERRTELGRTER